MKFTRLILIAAVLLAVYASIRLVLIQPWFLVLFGIAAIAVAGKRGYAQLTACGTARWADADDLTQGACSARTQG